MRISKSIASIILGFVLCVITWIITTTRAESLTCLAVYREGGAPAVFQSPKCPRWKLSTEYGGRKSRSRPPSDRCQLATHQGRRKSQEDRILCALNIRIPFPGLAGVTEVKAGLVAVFDGHNGLEASEMASKLLLEYFMLHTYFLLDTTFSYLSRKRMGRLPNEGQHNLFHENIKWDKKLGQYALDLGRFMLTLLADTDSSFHLEILREALLSAIHDVDATISREAFRNNFDSGSTATVILMADNQILVANIGDSKAFLCSEVSISPAKVKATLSRLFRRERNEGAFPLLKDYRSSKLALSSRRGFFISKELTRDHHPDRDDERVRVETAGGHVSEWGGVARVNGQLAVSRAIGDVHFRSYGVISVPEVTEWEPLTENDSYLVVASDGIFESLSSKDVCELLWVAHDDVSTGLEETSSSLYSLADFIVKTALERGSMDNMAVAVIPFTSSSAFQTAPKERCDGLGQVDCSTLGYQKGTNEWPADRNTSRVIEMEDAHPVVGNLDRLMVKGDCCCSGCFYLSENLDENDDHTFRVHKDDQEYRYDLRFALPAGVAPSYGGPLNLYGDQHMCMQFGMKSNGNKDHCINPENFARFVALLESIPLHSAGPDEQTIPDSRYKLKKRYDRGAYGEVWLAFHWNCSHVSKDLQWNLRYKNSSFNMHPGAYQGNSTTNSSTDESVGSSPNDNMFILKRIMVERGPAIYLSGLREKHFGEIFLNASTSLGGSPSSDVSVPLMRKSACDMYCVLQTNKSVNQEMEDTMSEKIVRKISRPHRSNYEEGLNHIARYVESFESRSKDMWLVFRHEGVSLSKLLYTTKEMISNADEGRDEHVKNLQILRPSEWWHWLKTTESGQEETRNLIRQLLMALKSCHSRNITHRDIKPENMVICFEEQDSGRCLKGSPSQDKNYKLKMRIIDFGSSVDEFTLKHLYGSVGPSRAEQTYEYTPPEALLNASWYRGPQSTTVKYDMWSVGVVILELILGSPNVFQINSKTRVLLDQHLDGWNEDLKELAYKLRSLMEMCILNPGVSSRSHHKWHADDRGSVSPVSWRCSEEFFSQQIKSRDPLNIGFPNVWALRLVRELLSWHPEDRLSVDDALQHPYFSLPSQK